MKGYQIQKETGYGDENRHWTDPIIFTDFYEARRYLQDELKRQQIDCCRWAACRDPFSINIEWNDDYTSVELSYEIDFLTISLRTVEIRI